MKVWVNNLSRGKRKVERLAKLILQEEGLDGEVSITFVGDREIRELNKRYLGRDRPTDVIAFPIHEHGIIGDIYISIDTAKRQAAQYGQTLEEELLLLTAHGVLHLAGYGDRTEEERKKMREKERYYLSKL
ncbi:rRNA maturation RNase YbeY [bacterium]|nr:MAG: rRNA maturation RNase YbeY [bacterium]